MTNPLHDLAEAFGVDTHYWDWRGEHRTVRDETLRSVLAAMDVDPDDPAAADGLRRALPPTIATYAGRPVRLTVAGPVVVELEDGGRREVPGDGAVSVPGDLPIGYHRITAGGATAHLIVAPERLELPSGLDERPGWGLATQLYSVRSRESWGVGDLADLRTLARWAAGEHGADFVLVNPVHAGEVVPPLNPSPYLPTSRRFANPLYLRIEDLPEFAELTAEQQATVGAAGAEVRGVMGERIERDAPWTAKLAALDTLLRLAPPRGRRADDYAAYRAQQGEALDRFATWCALCEQHGNDWRDWPEPLRDPSSAAVAAFAAADGASGRVEFFRRVQWLLEEQLRAVQADAVASGMRIGIVHDVAVGVSPSGADAWANQDAMATSVTVGAPPDAYSQLGQDWQQPPWRPDRLAESGYRPFREMFAAALAHCGGLRVDHVIGLFRLWWIPRGREALDGTYVHYDRDALLGVLAIEARRAGAVVVGEDLGNVEPTAHDELQRRGVLGTSILWFENADGAPLPAERWRELCLASVTTHDLPPTAGFLAGDHIRLRDSLHLLTRSLDDELTAGQAEQQAWLDLLRRENLLGSEEQDTDAVVLALHRFLLGTPSRLRLVALTDAVGDRRTQNQPGTVDEYPNWRVALAGPDGVPIALEDVVTDARAARLLAVFA